MARQREKNEKLKTKIHKLQGSFAVDENLFIKHLRILSNFDIGTVEIPEKLRISLSPPASPRKGGSIVPPPSIDWEKKFY